MPDSQAGQPRFDRAVALAAVAGNENLLRQVAQVFLMHHTAVCAQIDEALADAQHSHLREIAHDLKGMGGSMGAYGLSNCARTVEAAVASDSLELVQAVAAMRSELERVHLVMAAIAQG